ncbi:hypothetical protein GL218_03893 [Daldinia childiae]|uniref:uncharacterized protein n=1 Tax=Daldinia childiae TaxID=326645 RepID=UPI001447CCB8|nr:uncharacterized protein GL218_03893 [Daldinia childiae]KAF3061713.1 hypothetical protein GL218_03893 [Daldinia childiae]
MDPPHLTEFASQRYFDKLKQLSESKDQPHDAIAQAQDGPIVAESSTFILPIRRPKAVDQVSHDTHRAEKRRGNFIGFKILPSRNSVDHDSRRLSVDSTKRKSTPFDQLFLALPNELKIQIIASLPLSDVLSLRLASRSWHAMITVNEFPIARYHLEHHVPAYAKRLYPVPDPTAIRLHYLCGIWHRLHVAAKLSYLICERVTKEIFLRTTEAQRLEFEPQYERMRRRLIPLLFTVFHFFETYRTLHIEYIKEHGHGLSQEPYTLNPIELKIMSMYDDQTLLRVHQVFPLVVSSFCRRLRPPSYVGRLERSLRGYLKDRPPDEVYVTAMCVGGLRQVERFWEIKGYNSRRGAVDSWYSSVLREPMEVALKTRRGFRGLTRKKSSASEADFTRSGEPCVNGRGRQGSDVGRRGSDASMITWENLVFNTSLAEGMPMGELSREQLKILLPDLPNLQDIWLPTAEALILDRGIVERPQDIKRNAQVMLELIREDGAAEEDEWWYGRTAPESVRPPLEAIEEDPIE